MADADADRFRKKQPYQYMQTAMQNDKRNTNICRQKGSTYLNSGEAGKPGQGKARDTRHMYADKVGQPDQHTQAIKYAECNAE